LNKYIMNCMNSLENKMKINNEYTLNLDL